MNTSLNVALSLCHNELMKLKYTLLFFLFTGFCFFIFKDEKNNHMVQKKTNRISQLTKKNIPPESNHSLAPSKKANELTIAGLSESKVKAIYDLKSFHNRAPAFNEENIRRRNQFLDELTKNTPETIKAFSKIMKHSKDDSLKSFLLNLTMNTSMNDSDKAEIFMSRIKLGGNFNHEGLLPDEEMSLIIGISHLSRLEDERVKAEALEQIMDDVEISHNDLLKKTVFDYLNPN